MGDYSAEFAEAFFPHWSIGLTTMAHGLQETLHRLVKQAIDSGQASSIEEAERRFQGYRLHFSISGSHSVADQAALLTGVALGRRVFLGGVTVGGALESPLLIPMPLGKTLRDAVRALGCYEGDCDATETPTVVIGGGPQARKKGFVVRTVCEGWRGGVVPAHSAVARGWCHLCGRASAGWILSMGSFGS